MRTLLVFAGTIFAAAIVQAQIFVLLNRNHSFEQTGASTTSEVAGTPWTFEAAISGSGLTGSYPATPNRITLPDTVTVYNLSAPSMSDSEWRYRPSGFSTLGDMTTAYPDGTYKFEWNGNTWMPTLGSTSFAGAAPVGSLSISGTWSGNTLTISSAQAAAGFSISNTWAGGDGFTSGSSRVGLYVDKMNGPDSFTTVESDNGPTFTTSSASVNIAGGTMLAGNTYKVGLEFNYFLAAPADFETGVFKAVVINTMTTEFLIQVVPEPSTYAEIFGVLALTGAVLHRRRRLV